MTGVRGLIDFLLRLRMLTVDATFESGWRAADGPSAAEPAADADLAAPQAPP
jgi:hypothetical protein